MSQFQSSIPVTPEPIASETKLEAVLSALISKINHLEQQLNYQNAEMQTLKQQIPTQLPIIPSTTQPNTTSRRKLLKKLGYGVAAIAAASATALAQNNAEAASGDAVLAGNSNIASNTTYLSQTNNTTSLDKNAILWGDWNPNDQSSLPLANSGVAGTSTAGPGVYGASTGGVGGYFDGALAPIQLKPSTTTNAPTTGTHTKGELFVDSTGSLFICKADGTPGTWAAVGSGTGGGVTAVTGNAPLSFTTGATPVGTIAITTTNDGGAVALQASTPGTAQTGNINITGSAIVNPTGTNIGISSTSSSGGGAIYGESNILYGIWANQTGSNPTRGVMRISTSPTTTYPSSPLVGDIHVDQNRVMWNYNGATIGWTQMTIPVSHSANAFTLFPLAGQLHQFTDKGNQLYYFDKYTFSSSTFSGWYNAGNGFSDSFTKTPSSIYPGKASTGQSWIPKQGTWGVNSNQLYSVTDAAGDIVLAETYIQNPTLQCRMSGQNTGSSRRESRLLFCGLDANNFLWVDLAGGTILRLCKQDAGTGSVLTFSSIPPTTDGTLYRVVVVVSYPNIVVYVNSIFYITFNLTASDFKFLEYTKIGASLNKSGSPTIAARWQDFYVRQSA